MTFLSCVASGLAASPRSKGDRERARSRRLRGARIATLTGAFLLAFLPVACGIGDSDTDGGTAGSTCEGQVTSCAQLAGGSCDGQDGCFSGGQIGTCNGSATECVDLTDDDECLAQEGCRLADD